MKKIFTLAAGVFLSGLLSAVVNAGPNDNRGSPQKDEKSDQLELKKSTLSKHNQRKLEQAKKAKMRREGMNKSKSADKSQK